MWNVRQKLIKLGQCLVEMSWNVCNPFLSFRVDISGLQIIKYYSHKHKLHFLETFVYDFACFTLRHGQDLIQFHQSTCINNIIYFVVESEFVYMLNDNVVVEGESINIFVNKIEIIIHIRNSWILRHFATHSFIARLIEIRGTVHVF